MASVGIYLTEPPYGLAKVRQRAMLNVIGAQEVVEHKGTTRPQHVWGSSNTARFKAWEREFAAYVRRRNAAERPLRADERAVWAEWRRGDEAARERIRAMLEDVA